MSRSLRDAGVGANRGHPLRGALATAFAAPLIVVASLTSGGALANFFDVSDNVTNILEAAEWEAFVGLGGGLSHSCGVNDEGAVWCWGRNDKGQLGDNTTADSSIPVRVVGGSGTLDGVVGIGIGDKHGCGVKADGSVWCWGLNTKGQLGNNTTADSRVPVQVLGPGGSGTLSGVVAVAGGAEFSCAVKADGTAWCWGMNSKGQLGINTTSNSLTPVQVLGPGGSGTLTGVIGVATEGETTCAVKGDGTAWCWGLNNRGQLGNNTTANSSTPVQVLGPGGSGTLTGVIGVAAGGEFSCAAKGDGTAWCWGMNSMGQLGNNTTSNSLTPVQVVGPGGSGTLTGVAAVTTGGEFSCAAKADGTAWCWGRNDKGQLGNNTTTNSSAPVQVVGEAGTGLFADATVIGAGDKHACAATQHHTVWCWGLNVNGQLGNNTTTDSKTPVRAIGT